MAKQAMARIFFSIEVIDHSGVDVWQAPFVRNDSD
jgi:hypothetical protein